MRVLALAREDVRRALRDYSSIFWIFLAPFLWVFLFGQIGGSTDPTQARIGLLVVQGEASPRADRLVDLLRAESFEVTVVRPGEARPPAEDAPARTLTIPAGFDAAVAARRKVELPLREERRTSPEGTLAVQVVLHRATVRMLADEALGGFTPDRDAVRVRSSWATARKPPSGIYQSLPGNLVMFVLLASMTYGAALLAGERLSGTLRRLAATPLRRWEVIVGKALGRGGIAGVQVMVFVVMGLAVFRIDWGSSPAALVAVLASTIAAAASLGLLAGTVFRSPDAAAGFGVFLSLLMSAAGGCWWPSELMPAWVRRAGHAFPTAWAMDGLHGVISWGGGLAEVALPCAVLLAFAAAATLVAARLLRF